MLDGEGGKQVEEGVEQAHDSELVVGEPPHLWGDVLGEEEFVKDDGPKNDQKSTGENYRR